MACAWDAKIEAFEAFPFFYLNAQDKEQRKSQDSKYFLKAILFSATVFKPGWCAGVHEKK